MDKHRVVLVEKGLSHGAIIHDPFGVVVECTEADKQSDVIQRVKLAAAKIGKRTSKPILTIMAHGAESQTLSQATYDKTVAKALGHKPGQPRVDGIGGFGIAISSPPMLHKNLNNFQQWEGLFSKIVLLVCSIAQTRPEFKGGPGDGKLFCTTLAKNTKTKFLVDLHLHNCFVG